MNAFERTTQMGRELFEINTETLRKITELSAENFRKYMELNQDYLQKLPEIREVGAFVELQRDYGQTLWEGVQEDFRARGDILREAAEETGSLLRGLFNTAAEEGEKAAEAVKDAAAA